MHAKEGKIGSLLFDLTAQTDCLGVVRFGKGSYIGNQGVVRHEKKYMHGCTWFERRILSWKSKDQKSNLLEHNYKQSSDKGHEQYPIPSQE